MSPGIVVSACFSGLTVALLIRTRSPWALRTRLGIRSAASSSRSARRARLRLSLTAVAATAVAVVVLGDRLHLLILAATGIAAAYAGTALRRCTVRRTERHRRQAETVDVCDALVAELAAGTPPPRALAHVAADWPPLRPAARTAELGGDIAQTLRSLSGEPGRESLRELAAAWEVSLRSGAGLAVVIDRLTGALRQDEEARQEVIASLGPSRATARVLAVLPLFGLGLGAGIGGDPLAVLLESLLGAICVCVGGALAIAGLFWVERIADSAEAT